jgi:hypothetical protein
MALYRPRWAVVASVLFANSIWYSSALEHHHRRHLIEDIPLIHQGQANDTSPVAVLGIRNSVNDTAQPRLEIRELERRPDEFNVFLLGLQRLQSIHQSDKLSYYQIAGTVQDNPKADVPCWFGLLLTIRRYSWDTIYTMGWCPV